ncbi:MAG: hypothetical protein ACP59X_03420 [Solidesulfovibrio sp. DCME]|uniref:hypothetical protein n=1 Tax=Solidesulfovibrio sp. DCME TaxID=3447380 RepID=UPI003D14606B
MINKTFPFQKKISNDKVNTIGFIEMLHCIEALNNLPEDTPMADTFKDSKFLENIGFTEFKNVHDSNSSNDSWPLNNCYGGKENLFLKVFIISLKSQLNSSVFNETKDLLTKELDSIEYAISYKDKDIGDLLISAQESILKTGAADSEATSILYDLLLNYDMQTLVKEQNPEWHYILYFLFKYIPKDIDAICNLFEKLNTNKENVKIKTCYGLIGSFGMRILTHSIIHNSELNPVTISNLRRYSELFTTAFDLLYYLPVASKTYTKKASELIILTLIKAAYKLGTIDREKDFYTEESLDHMSSLGTSHAMNEAFKIKYENCEKLAQEADDLWRKGDTRHHGAMADYLLSTSKYAEHVSKTLLLKRLKEVAKKYRRVRGVKKQ